ncbi:MAG: TolC family protein [Bacteroidia bacterium]|nr:TolC family protein [Bacteroidia bacterium]
MKYILTAALMIFSVAYAQDSLQLDHAISIALTERSDLQQYEVQARRNEAQLQVIKTQYLPQLSGNVQGRYNFINPVSVLPANIFDPSQPSDELISARFGTNWSYSAGVSLSQPLYAPSVGGQVSEQLLEARRSQIDARGAREQVVADVTEAYYGVLAGESEISLALADSLAAATVYQNLVEEQRAGRTLAPEVEQAELQLAQVTLRLRRTRQNLLTLKQLLLSTMNQPLDQAENMVPAVSLESCLRELEEPRQSSGGVADRVELAQLSLEQDLLRTQALNQRKLMLPTLSLDAYLGANHFSNSFEPFNGARWFGNSYAGLSLNIPITDIVKASRNEDVIETEQAENRLEQQDFLRKAGYEVADAQAQLDYAWQNLAIQRRAVQLAENQLQVATAQSEEGRSLDQARWQAAAQAQQARYNALKACYDVLIADLRLRQAQGKVME